MKSSLVDETSASDATAELAAFTCDLQAGDLPKQVVQRLRECLLDYVGVAAFASFDTESSTAFRRGIRALAGAGGDATVIGETETYPPQYAALLNGAYGHTLDFDDTNQEGVLHPGVAVIPAALAEAEAQDCDGPTFLAALAAGYEVACRVGAALGASAYDRGFHLTSVAGVFGAVAAAARIRGLNTVTLLSAFGLASSKAAGSMQCLDNGAWNKRLHPGFAAHDALICLALAEAGVKGAARPLEGRFGVLVAYSNAPRPDQLTNALGKRWLLTGTAFKPYPSCRMTHAAIDAVLAIREAIPPSQRQNVRFQVRLSNTALQLVGEPASAKRCPTNVVEAQFSIQFQVALAWLDGRCQWDGYTRIGAEDILALSERVEVSSDPDLQMAGAHVRVEAAGVTHDMRVEEPLGEPSRPLSWDQLEAKYMALATPVFGTLSALNLASRIHTLENVTSMRQLVEDLRGRVTTSQLSSQEQIAVRCVIARGGTSKGAYFHERDLPAPGPARDILLKQIMGSPDLIQIDGLGGSRLITSKIAIVKRSLRSDADVDYTFAQVDPASGFVAYDANCGNISAGVGPFAVDEKLVEVVEPETVVRIFNTNTCKVLIARVSIRNGKAAVNGNTQISGVPGSGAEVFMDYSNSIGAKSGRLLPTGRAIDIIDMQGFGQISVTLCDVANPAVFVAASDLGLTASEHPPQVNDSEATIQALRELRGKAAVLLGICSDWRRVDEISPNLPMVMFVAPPAEYVTTEGARIEAASMDLRARFVFFNKCHESMAGTGSMCLAAASRIPDSVVNRAIGQKAARTGTLRIGHPLGIMTVQVEAIEDPVGVVYRRLGFSRTARRIMAGEVYVKR